MSMSVVAMAEVIHSAIEKTIFYFTRFIVCTTYYTAVTEHKIYYSLLT